MNILVLAAFISPTKGSEYSVAWNYVKHMSKYNNLTVVYGASGDVSVIAWKWNGLPWSILCLV